MSRNNILVILVSLLVVVGFAYFFLSPKYGPQVEVENGNNEQEQQTSEGQDEELPEEPEGDTISESDAVELAKADLEDFGVDAGSADVISVELQPFGDTSLGCPQEGQSYAQVVTAAFLVLLENGDEEYDYRVSVDGNTVIKCEE